VNWSDTHQKVRSSESSVWQAPLPMLICFFGKRVILVPLISILFFNCNSFPITVSRSNDRETKNYLISLFFDTLLNLTLVISLQTLKFAIHNSNLWDTWFVVWFTVDQVKAIQCIAKHFQLVAINGSWDL